MTKEEREIMEERKRNRENITMKKYRESKVSKKKRVYIVIVSTATLRY
jgi:hypothetical protein